MPTHVQGIRGAYYARATEVSTVRDVADRIALLQPEAAPLITFTNALRGKKEAINTKFEWLEDDLSGQTVAVVGAIGTSTTIVTSATDCLKVRNGDILIAPAGEAIRVTSGEGTEAFVCVRDLGGGGSETLAAADQLVIAGNALQDGVTSPTYRWTAKATVINFIQNFRDSVLMSDAQVATESYGGDDRLFQRKKVAIEHKRGIETAFLLGSLYGSAGATGDAANTRTTKGLYNFISTNVTDVSGTVTEAEFETFLRGLFRYTASTSAATKVVFACPLFISALNFWAKNALEVRSDEKTYGMRIATYRSGHGDIDIVRHWLLADFTNFAKMSFFVDPENIKYRYLRGLDTKLHVDIATKSYDYKLDEYRTYAGFQCQLEKTHGLLKGITGYAA